MQVVILAGGLATRLRPLTEKIPKALIDINGDPFIHYQLNYLKKQGISNVVLCIGFLADQIQGYVGDGKKYGLTISYSLDGKELLGTGGAIKNAINYLDDNFFVMYGDSFLPVNFREIYQNYINENKNVMMTLLKNNNQWDRSNVIFKNNKISLYDKNNLSPMMNYIDYGLSLFSKETFINMTIRKFDLADIFNSLSIDGNLGSFEIFERFYEIGSLAGISEFKEYVKINNLGGK